MGKYSVMAVAVAALQPAVSWSMPANAFEQIQSGRPLPPASQQLKIDAPTYPSARRFEAPERPSYHLSAKTSSFKTLMEHPAAWALVLKEVPVLAVFVKAPAAAPFLANFSLQNALEIGLTTQAKFDLVDQQLRSLEMVR